MPERWTPDSWRRKPIAQVPDYPDTRQTLTLYFENDALVRFTGRERQDDDVSMVVIKVR